MKRSRLPSVPAGLSQHDDTIKVQWFMDFCRDWTFNGTGPNDCRAGFSLRKPWIPDTSYDPYARYVVQSPRSEYLNQNRYHIYKMDLDATDPWTVSTRWRETPEGRVRGVILWMGEGGFGNEWGGTLAGATIEIDWIRLVPRDGSTTAILAWSGFGGTVTLTARHRETGDTIQIFPDDGTSATTFADNRSFTWDYGFLPPGTWDVTATRSSNSRTVTLSIDPAPVAAITDPDETGGQDLARTVIGDAWDMTNPEDLSRYGWTNNLASPQFGDSGFQAYSLQYPQAGHGDPAVWLTTDDNRTPAQRLTIDGTRFHRLSFTMELDHPELSVTTGLLDNQWGSVARVIWRPTGMTGGLLTNSQDIWVMDGGPRTYSMDLSTMTRSGGRLCTDCDIEDTSETPWVAQNPWGASMAALRIDPHEGTNARWFKISNVTLAADDAPNANGFFLVRWNTFDATFSRSVATSGGADATVSLYWDTDQDKANGRTAIASGLPTAQGSYLWNTGALARNQRIWLSVDIVDVRGNTQTRYSSGPLAIPATGAAFTDADRDGLDDAWETRYSVSSPSADDDGDGVTNLIEYQQGTSPRIANRWVLAEGNTSVFRERIALVNPEADPAQVVVQYLRRGEPPVTRDYTVGGYSRLTIDVNSVEGLAGRDVSAVVTATAGAVVAERTMLWGSTTYGGHTGKAIQTARTTWYLAEGDAGFFDTFILLANPDATQDATVTATFMLEPLPGAAAEPPIVLSLSVPAQQRQTVRAREVNVNGRSLAGRAFSTRITSTVPVNVERAMYFGPSPGQAADFWPGGHEAPAVASPATQWFVAEGATGDLFDTYLLLANPNDVDTDVDISYLTDQTTLAMPTMRVPRNSRKTIRVDDAHPALASVSVSASIRASQPIIVERAMYWPGNYNSWYEAHNSAGVTSTGTVWALAEGEKGGSLAFASYVLFANPGTTDATVRVSLLRASGRTEIAPFVVPAGRRVTKCACPSGLADNFPVLASGEKFGFLVESDQPVVVERSMYWNGGNQFWGGGTNETAVKIR
jgi:hypothetical protein